VQTDEVHGVTGVVPDTNLRVTRWPAPCKRESSTNEGRNNMSKKTKKLGLKKETLRSLNNEQLSSVAGGTDLVALSVITLPPSKGTFGCDTVGCLNLQYNQIYYKY
jgi:hypothetical protein